MSTPPVSPVSPVSSPRPGSRRRRGAARGAGTRPGSPTRRAALPRSRNPKLVTHRWARWLHVYTSMIALVLVLFFGLTGLTLNHPQWTFGDAMETTRSEGTFPFDPLMADGTVNYLRASEYAREELGVAGRITTFRTTGTEASISYRNPGYAADLFYDVRSGDYQVTVQQQGWLGVLNDLHKGRDSGSTWSWVVDVSALFLVAIAVTGLVMQLFLRKRRTSALALAGIGLLLTVVLAWIALG
ncbi:MAG: PepSY-associated TM helix domain-containing protein [Actinomycetota bacterium]